jgi:hypothetical protein
MYFDLCGKNSVMEKKMKKKYPVILLILLITIISACGPAPAPTLSAADVQGTAVADAWIALTLTQAAIPTATGTPIPPLPTITFTPLPTFTPYPTLAPAATLPDTSATNPCDEPPPIKTEGDKVKIKFVNKSSGNVTLSFGMTQENSFKECGTYSFYLAKFDEPVVEVLAGCYWGYGWVDGNEPSTAQTPDILCVTDTSKATAIWITSEVISFH